jgi:molybdopterin molybdotransferase
VAEAVAVLESLIGPIEGTARVPVAEAAGRVLANPVSAARAQPHYRRSERDGYALRGAETEEAADAAPVELRTTDPPLEAGEASYVHTGSAVPDGADAVLQVEDVAETEDGITVTDPVEAGTHVTQVGDELAADEDLYAAGHRLRPGDLGTLRVAGHREVRVRDPPTVAVIPTGEELVGEEPEPGEVVETNGLVGAAQVESWGGAARYREVVTDDREALAAAIDRDLDADLIVTTGGSSVGARDLLPAVVADRGEVLVDGLATRPGHSARIGAVADTPIALLPGTPIAALVVARLLVRPVLARAVETETVPPPTVRARLESELRSEPGIRTVHGMAIDGGEEASDAPSTREADRGGLPARSRIDGWVQVSEGAESVEAGTVVSVELWDAGSR